MQIVGYSDGCMLMIGFSTACDEYRDGTKQQASVVAGLQQLAVLCTPNTKAAPSCMPSLTSGLDLGLATVMGNHTVSKI